MIRLESLLLYQEHGGYHRKLATLGGQIIFIKVVTLRGGPHRHGDVQAWCSSREIGFDFDYIEYAIIGSEFPAWLTESIDRTTWAKCSGESLLVRGIPAV